MRITITDLRAEVADLNDRYSKRSKKQLTISYAYGGYEVNIQFKPKYQKIHGTGVSQITNGHDSASKTIEGLYLADSRGWIRDAFKRKD